MCGDEYVWVRFEGFSIVACYIFPNIPRERFESSVDEVMNLTRDKGGTVTLIGDLNAKSHLWRSAHRMENEWGVPDRLLTSHYPRLLWQEK